MKSWGKRKEEEEEKKEKVRKRRSWKEKRLEREVKIKNFLKKNKTKQFSSDLKSILWVLWA